MLATPLGAMTAWWSLPVCSDSLLVRRLARSSILEGDAHASGLTEPPHEAFDVLGLSHPHQMRNSHRNRSLSSRITDSTVSKPWTLRSARVPSDPNRLQHRPRRHHEDESAAARRCSSRTSH